MQFPEAVEMLAEKAGIALPRATGRKDDNGLADQLYKINELASQFFETGLANNKQAAEYLASRGVGEEARIRFRIGYAPDSWEALINFFKAKGVAAPLLEKAGLAIANDKGGHYDRFRDRIIFPITDLKNRILGFGARVLDGSLPKYINSPETAVYSKGRNLYGLNVSRDYIKKARHALVVEGYLDFLIPYQAGVRNLIATLGTALTVDQIKLLKRFANTVVMAYDPDEAGEAASLRNLELFITEDVNVYIAELPGGFDPDGYIRKFGAEDFVKLIKSSKNLFDYKIDKLSKRFNMNTTNGKAAIASEMLPTIAKINNEVLKSGMVKRLAEKLGVDEESVKAELKKVKPAYAKAVYAAAPAEARPDSRSAEMMVLALLFDGERFVEKVRSELSPEEFKDSSVRDLVSAIFGLHKEKAALTPAKLISRLGQSAAAANLISEAANILEIMRDKDKALSDCVARIKKDNAKEALGKLQEAMRSAHAKKDEGELKRLVSEYNRIVKDTRA